VSTLRSARTDGISAEQATAIVEVAGFIVRHEGFGEDDPANTESLAGIRPLWLGKTD